MADQNTDTAEPVISLAPMAGVTDWPFRLLCAEYGARVTYTEMIAASGMAQSPRQAYETLRRFVVMPREAPVIAQIFGHDPADMAAAARMLSDALRYCGIDINMGCPARKVVSSGSGSALLRDAPLAARIMRAVRAATPLPVSVKLRIGWDTDSEVAPAFAHMAQEEGLQGVTVHGRTREQQYSGQCDLAAIRRVVRAVSIPVTGNGDVRQAADALRMLSETGCAHVMVGRGAMGNPFLFREINAALRGEACPPPTGDEVADTALRHADMMAACAGERACIEMRKHFAWYLAGRRGAAQARAAIFKAPTLEEAKTIMQRALRA